jgi:type I restriction enzyme S subunit
MSGVWTVTKVGNITDVVTKGTTPTSVGFKFVDSGINFIKVESIGEDGLFRKNKIAHINKECHEALRRSQLQVGDILFSIAGALGRVAIVSKDVLPANTNQALSIIRLKKEMGILPEFLVYTLKSNALAEQIEKQRGGAAQQNLSLSQVKNFEVSLPSVREQKRIVAILDEAFAGIDAAIANTEKNLANARELFESYLNSVFSQRGERWIERSFSEVLTITSKLVDPRELEHQNLLHVGAGNIISMKGDLVDLQTAAEEGLKSGKFIFDDTMVLYSKIRPYLMKVVRPEFSGLCSADIYPLSPKEEFICRDFLYYLLLSNDFTDYAIAGSARAGMPKVNRAHLFAYSVALPEVDEQRKLVEQLEAVTIETRRLESIYQQKLDSLMELKQSLLQQAFSGELTANVTEQKNDEAVA